MKAGIEILNNRAKIAGPTDFNFRYSVELLKYVSNFNNAEGA